MQNNYDRVAWIYDPLSKMVFGNSLKHIQTDLLDAIGPGANILIVGGGTGWILEEISKRNPIGLNITYIEISQNMLELAKKRDIGQNLVTFLHSPIEHFRSPQDFDIIFTAFLFDNFSPNRSREVFDQLDSLLKPNGQWLFADFNLSARKSDFWQRWLFKTMLSFFQILSDIEAKNFESMEPLFSAKGYVETQNFLRYGRFLKSVVYKKPGWDINKKVN